MRDVHAALQHFGGGRQFGALVRAYSRKEQGVAAGIWVYWLGYTCLLTDQDGYDGAAYGTLVTHLKPTQNGPGKR